MVSRRTFNTLLAAGVITSMTPEIVKAQGVPKAKNVVLVHGLYADGSSWLDVIAHLQTAGLHATAVQNPLMSLEEDSAAVRRILAQQDGPTVLVGHSFAGTLISETGGDPVVSALVYVAARAPAAGEDFGALAAQFPETPAAAGRVKPSFCQVSTEDRTINPELERFLAKRMKAPTIELASGPLSLVSHPREIADLILAAAGHGG